MEIDERLLPSWLGSEDYRTMLFSALNPESGPSIYYVYGVRNVGKTVTLKYLASKANAAYLDALNEHVDFERIVKELEDHDLVIVDEVTHVSLGRLKDLPALLEKLSEILFGIFKKKGIRKKIIVTASYSVEHYEILDRLVRIYAKHLKEPISKRGSPQPYRIHALPRTFLQAAAYRLDLDTKDRRSLTKRNLVYALIRYAIPEAVPVKYDLVGPAMIFRRSSIVNDELVERYFLTGGFPSLIIEAKEKEVSALGFEAYMRSLEKLRNGYEYMLQEFRKVVPKEMIEQLEAAFLGKGDVYMSFDELSEAAKTYMIIPVPVSKEPINRNIESFADFDRYRPVPVDPGVVSAIVYGYFKDDLSEGNFGQLRGALMESAVLLHLLYIIGYSNPRTRSRKIPPVVSPPSGPDFIAYVTGYTERESGLYREIPLVVEVKARGISFRDLESGSEFLRKTLRRLALVGYYYSVYPILVTPYKPPISVVNVRLDPSEAPEGYPRSREELREAHEKNRTRYFLGESPYIEEKTRKVVLLSLKELSLGVPLRFIREGSRSRAFRPARSWKRRSAIIMRIFVSSWTLGSKWPCLFRSAHG